MTCPCMPTPYKLSTYPNWAIYSINTLATAAATRFPRSTSYLQGQRSRGWYNMPMHSCPSRVVHIPELVNVGSILGPQQLSHKIFSPRFRSYFKFKVIASRSMIYTCTTTHHHNKQFLTTPLTWAKMLISNDRSWNKMFNKDCANPVVSLLKLVQFGFFLHCVISFFTSFPTTVWSGPPCRKHFRQYLGNLST